MVGALIQPIFKCISVMGFWVDELKENNATVELSFDAIEVANFLINEEYECDMLFTGRKTKRRKYEIEDLEQIAEHLLVYCKHNNIEEE